MKWEIYALRYGWQDRKVADNFLHPHDPHDGEMPLDYFVWLLRNGTQEILVDTGFTADTLARRAPGSTTKPRFLSRPVEVALQEMGSDVGSIEDVIITHLHYDHAGNLPLFPKARFHLQEREMQFATGRYMCAGCLRGAFDVDDVVDMVRAVYAGRVVFHDGDAQVAPGVRVHRVGGHTDGLQMVSVETERGTVVLASDAAHYYENLRRQDPFPIVFHTGDMVDGWARARELAGGDESRIIPGHDPEVRQRFPAVAGSEGETVQLHLPPKP